MHHRLLSVLLIPMMLIPAAPTSAGVESPIGWTNRLVVTYASPLRGGLPAGVQEVRADGRRVVVDLGRQATPADLRRFRDPSIISVEPDRRMQAAITPSDPSFSSQWDMSDAGRGAADYSVRAPGAWEFTTGSSDLVIAVLDTGITSHTEFSGRLVAGYDFVSETRTANDGDLRDSDPSDPGDWITSTEAASGFFVDCEVGDSSWHGTHVAGTIGATGNNASGIAGLNWTSKIQPIRVLGKCGGYTSDIADAIRWASGDTVAGVPANATPARIISLSLGGYSPSCSTEMQSAINVARSRGSFVVVAAGNEDFDASFSDPANCAGVITVAATGRDGKRAYYSNYGSTVEIAAPGGNRRIDSGILSTLNTGTRGPSRQSYVSYQGTSMATPQVAGVLSLLLSLDPTLSEAEVLDLLETTSTPFPSDGTSNSCSIAGKCGAGIINATALLAAVAPVKEAQTIEFPTQADRYTGGAAFDPGAIASSGLPVAYSVSTSSVCTTNGSLITIRRAGTCLITASQTGNINFYAASPVSGSVTIAQPARASITSDPSIGAAPVVGTLLTMSAGTWRGTPTPTISTSWLQCSKSGSASTSTSARAPSGCVVIGSATGPSYTPVLADAGKFLRVAETATNAAGASTRYSATTPAVQMPPSAPASLVAPTVPSSIRAGSNATAKAGTFLGTQPMTYTYNWYTCTSAVASSTTLAAGCSEISGQNLLKYRTTTADRGLYLVFRVTATNGLGTLSVYSASSGAVR